MKWLRLWPAFAAAMLLGCPREEVPRQGYVSLVRETGAPPTLTAELDNPASASGEEVPGEITMSAGVAMAVSCYDSCPEWVELCENVSITSDDAEVIEVWPAYSPSGRATYVLSARMAGSTTVRVTTRCGTKEYQGVVD